MEPAAFWDSLLSGIGNAEAGGVLTAVKVAVKEIFFLSFSFFIKFPFNPNAVWLIDHITLEDVLLSQQLLVSSFVLIISFFSSHQKKKKKESWQKKKNTEWQ